ncbi:hypothetical protein [Robiginitalea aurantiaca]|uniref:Lipocalin-like domain-containing protein n=1 Tax=Robiginitalea aurantiaca TaxID=3056915 RepID=A0ABT7WDI2_9FLAO|nr:hypothetical protein [Robiginitalea aurantiaca]MDM9630970.1 hypothetical protein [Robiginitalea aurantiaca]
MRTFSSLIMILAISAISSCSEIPENTDPVIGIWAQTQASRDSGAKHMEREEWIFNDAYLGRYNLYAGDELVVETDFQWEAHADVYTIHYPGLKKVKNVVKIKQNQEGNLLMDLQGNVLAYRE